MTDETSTMHESLLTADHEQPASTHERSFSIQSESKRSRAALREAKHMQRLRSISCVAFLCLAAAITAFILYMGKDDSSSTPPTAAEEAPAKGWYDYVIVGGGSAGCTLAARLSEDENTMVLLLESGGPTQYIPDKSSLSGTDFVAQSTCHDGDCGWRHLRAPTTPDGVQLDETPRQYTRFDVPFHWMSIPWSMYRGYTWVYDNLALGRILGGCGALNAMIYVRAVPADMQVWAEEFGVTGWGWDTVLSLFKKTEKNTGAVRTDATYHSTSGDMYISDASVEDPAGALFRQAAENSGIARNSDFNGASREGVGHYQFNTRDGVRDSPLTALLGPAALRPNLRVQTFATAHKIVFRDNKAIGVDYEWKHSQFQKGEGTMMHVLTRKEVIVTAGAINTPKLLMLSGIGPRERLEAVGIDVKVDLQGVGRNLHDHTSVNVIYPMPCDNLPTAFTMPLGPQDNYAWNRGGLLSTSGLTTGAFVQSPNTTHSLADVQFTVFPRDVSTNADGFMSVSVTLNRPTSRGEVYLRSSDPNEQPMVTQVNLKTQVDKDVLVWGVRRVREIIQQPPLSLSLADEVSPGPSVTTQAELEEYASKNAVLGNHWVGSAAMGEIDSSVVDSKLRVRGGLTGLRVADCSIVPRITNGNTHATCIMVAEHAAEIIKADA